MWLEFRVTFIIIVTLAWEERIAAQETLRQTPFHLVVGRACKFLSFVLISWQLHFPRNTHSIMIES